MKAGIQQNTSQSQIPQPSQETTKEDIFPANRYVFPAKAGIQRTKTKAPGSFVAAEDDGKNTKNHITPKTDEKIYINSNTLEVDYQNNIAEYKTNVFVQKKGNFDLYCDRAKIFSAPKESSKKNSGSYKIKHIELYDNITLVKGTKIAKGDSGVIYPQKKLIILTGKVQLKEKTPIRESYLEGREVKYYIDKEIFKVNDTISRDNSTKERVKIILNDEKDKK